MNFDSVFFLGVFFPFLMILYHLNSGRRWRNGILTAAGLVFYAFGSLQGLLMLILFALINFTCGILIQKRKMPRLTAAAAITFNLLFLCFFKYLHFLPEDTLLQWQVAVPLGISFFTFKAISYIADTLKKPENGTQRFGTFLLYLSFLPEAACGPISRFSDFESQLLSERICRTPEGLRRFTAGLSKKVLLSVPLGLAVTEIYSLDTPDFRLAWLAMLLYMLQIYLDFSGYSDMAIGLAQVFGISSPENFRYPYMADCITEFWRRWHISLSLWFRDYVYIPLGGNRKGPIRTGINKAIVFLLCGLWHGANWTFLLWGLWHGLLSILESSGMLRPKGVVGRIYTLITVGIGFLMFRASSVSQGLTMIGSLFNTHFTAGNTALLLTVLNPRTLLLAAAGILVCLPWKPMFQKKNLVWTYPVSLLLLILCLMGMAFGGFVPFIYAQF